MQRECESRTASFGSGYHWAGARHQKRQVATHRVALSEMCVQSGDTYRWAPDTASDTVYLTGYLAGYLTGAIRTRGIITYHKHIKIKLKGIKFWKVKISSSKIWAASVPCRNNLIAGHSALILALNGEVGCSGLSMHVLRSQNFRSPERRTWTSGTVINAQSIVLKKKKEDKKFGRENI